MSNRYIFDVDNTLVTTNLLNNAAYNFALDALHLPTITTHTRITRKVIFETYQNLSEIQKEKIVKLKQNYFKSNIHLTQPNVDLIKFLQSKQPSHCILWTSADASRVGDLLEHYKITDNFISLFYSNKLDLEIDIKKVCDIFNCSSKHLFFFEDEKNVVDKLRLLGQRVFSPGCTINLSVL